MTSLFFMLCWWVGVFTRPWVPGSLVSHGTMSLWKVPPPIAKFELSGRFVLYDEKGREIVAVNTRTGRVKLRGNPNAAAKRFWKAVEQMKGEGK